jgi:hypothetical protein
VATAYDALKADPSRAVDVVTVKSLRISGHRGRRFSGIVDGISV